MDPLSTRQATRLAGTAAVCAAVWITGCAPVLPPPPAPLFTVPLAIEGEPIGEAIIDTGGGYELILRESFGLPLLGKVQVLAFGGSESVDVTEGFNYSVGGVEATADFALVGVPVCDCNGVGFEFFRRTGVIIGLDFADLTPTFLSIAPDGGVAFPFAAAPATLSGFDTSFLDVEVTATGTTRSLRALVDTGTNSTVLRRGLFPDDTRLSPNLLELLVSRPELGTVSVTAGLFDTDGLPDLILGTDVMRAWGRRWYFRFDPVGGTVIVIPDEEDSGADSSTEGVFAAG